MKNSSIFGALDLAKYINYIHNKKYKRDISPLKLQKVLFFLFGEWGAFVIKSDINNDGRDLKKFPKYLFSEDFEAWVYGPVVSVVYKEFNNEQLEDNFIFKTEEEKYVGKFIEDLSLELFELSDFRLVELTHQMDCWRNKFNIEDTYHNNKLDKDEIINEFAQQV